MNRRQFVALAGLSPLMLGAGRGGSGWTRADYERAVVIDGLGAPVDREAEGDMPPPARFSAKGAAELRASGMTAYNVTLGWPGNQPENTQSALDDAAWWQAQVALNPDLLVHARDAAAIRAAKAAGKVAVVFGVQDTAQFGTDPARIDLFARFGVRIVQLTYNRRNIAGDGSLEPADAGLSTFGREMIGRIEERKLLLDLSHGGRRTIMEAIAAATRPMTISHTGARALNDNPRNVDDAAMRACAVKGGVVGIYLMPFLAKNSHPRRADVLAHLEHAVNVCGEDHVGIGTDGASAATTIDAKFRAEMRKIDEKRRAAGVAAPGEGPDVFTFVEDYNSPSRFRMIADDLAARGWPAARIEKVLGANVLRLYGEAWGG